MKIKISSLLLLTVLNIYGIFAQVTTKITDVTLNSQTVINNCGIIDFGTNSNNNLNFNFKLTKPSAQAIGNSTLKILLKYDSSYDGSEKGNLIVLSGSWVNNTEYTSTIQCNIYESEIKTTGSSIVLEFTTDSGVKTRSCEYPIKKTQTPTFTLSPPTVSMPCGSPAKYTFTVTNVYNSTGNLTYEWNMGTGWADYSSGIPQNGIFTTTSSSLSFKPYSFPYSNISVIPILDGVRYPQKTCVVSLTPYSSGAQITGSATICNLNSSSIYNLVNPPTGGPISVIWSSSNPAIATVSNNSNTQVTVNALNAQGNITLNAAITNSCGQTITKTFPIKIGNSIPNFNVIKSPGYLEICGNDYHYLFLDAVPLESSGSAYSYVFNGFTTGISNPNITYTQLSPTRFRFKIPKNKIPTGQFPTLVFNVTATSICGTSSSIYGKAITMDAAIIASCSSGSIPFGATSLNSVEKSTLESVTTLDKTAVSTDETVISHFTVYPNPTSESINIQLIENEINTLSKNKIKAVLYDIFGQQKRIVNVINNSANIDVRDLNKGIYILKIYIDDSLETHQVIIK